jgi:mono/diheme cytochrome c family protein
MKRYVAVGLAALAVVALGLPGCDDIYSSAVKYGVRTDPLMVATQLGDLGEDVYDPDRPGVLPLLKAQDVTLPDNPLSTKGAALFNTAKLRDPMLVPADKREELNQTLVKLFGTPAEPTVGGIDANIKATLKLDDATLKEGSRLYRIHCVHCHGVPGDGRGPTARWINPHPRDFRQGLFKFQSINQKEGDQANRPPRREDLLHTLQRGIEGTAMPSFGLLPPADLEKIVSYVIHLSLRGKSEFDTLDKSFNWNFANGAFNVAWGGDADLPATVKDWLDFHAERWNKSQDPKSVIPIPPYDEHFKKNGDEWTVWKDENDAEKWLIRGAIAQALFNNEQPRNAKARDILKMRGDAPDKANCKQCHADYGRQAKFKFDSWATLTRPNNFTLGVFRGGRRPADLFHRVHSGINGTPMTKFSDAISTNSIWDMVEFVQALSYPAMRKKLGVEID